MKPQLAKGVRDIFPEEKLLQNQVVDTLKEVFELYGFLPLETPILERYETLAAKFAAGEESDALKETFQLKDQGGRQLGLRFDLTVPLARFVAMNPNLKMPFKRYQMGPVFRDGPIKLGRYREFWQADIDTVGTSSLLADAEVLAAAEEVFNRLKLDIVIKVNNRKLLNGILEEAGIKKKEPAIVALDKLEKLGVPGVTDELLERGYPKPQIKKLFSLIDETITLSQLKGKIKDKEGQEGIKELEELFSYLKSMGVKSVKFDVSLARGLAYYTGSVFEVFARKGKVTSSITAGGRYDKMIGGFLGEGKAEGRADGKAYGKADERIVPAMGISFGLAPIMEALKEKKTEITSMAKAYVLPIGAGGESLNTSVLNASLKIVQELRAQGIKTSFALGKKGVSKNLEYANSLNIPYVLIIGENELKENKVLLKEMTSGTEQLLAVKEVVNKLKK